MVLWYALRPSVRDDFPIRDNQACAPTIVARERTWLARSYPKHPFGTSRGGYVLGI